MLVQNKHFPTKTCLNHSASIMGKRCKNSLTFLCVIVTHTETERHSLRHRDREHRTEKKAKV